jgi:hypothetical protein
MPKSGIVFRSEKGWQQVIDIFCLANSLYVPAHFSLLPDNAVDAVTRLAATMARADLLIDIVRAGAEGNQELFRCTLEALISGGRSKEPLIGTGSTSLDASPLRRFQRMQGEAV